MRTGRRNGPTAGRACGTPAGVCQGDAGPVERRSDSLLPDVRFALDEVQVKILDWRPALLVLYGRDSIEDWRLGSPNSR